MTPMNILLLYTTKEGQTEKIAQFMADALRQHGHRATTQLADQIPKDFNTDSFDAAIIGGSVHMGRFPGSLKKFIIEYTNWLNEIPSAFFTVCMAIHSVHEKERIAAKSIGSDFIHKTRWRPNLMETFAGAVKYTQYGFITRKIMQNISKKEGGNTDTSRDHEYTDWETVTKFTDQFLSKIGELEDVV